MSPENLSDPAERPCGDRLQIELQLQRASTQQPQHWNQILNKFNPQPISQQ
jgi:hypothetical protein